MPGVKTKTLKNILNRYSILEICLRIKNKIVGKEQMRDRYAIASQTKRRPYPRINSMQNTMTKTLHG
ncbi:hypothetical protein V6N12_050242 [Hibiscus sabdariffa]|uniref:Ribosomal protein S13 n=1 Tax=Hibiscus sabdariffa TaxID=183260 RepID=A0ABR2GBT8_9ROSI